MMQVLLPAGKIPSGATVTKRTGARQCTLREYLTTHPLLSDAEPETVYPNEGMRFLIDSRGNVNKVRDETKLLWQVEEDRLLNRLKAECGENEVTEMALCAAHHVFLRPDELYRFYVYPGCEECKDVASRSSLLKAASTGR